MEARIQFIKGLDEKVLPDVRLTRSRDGSTGTATFRFKNPNILDKSTAKEGEITGMYLIDEEGSIVKEYGPFQDGQEAKVITRSIELSTGFYTFVVNDAYGDGLCCDAGSGRWKLFKDGALIKSSNGRFGYYEEYDFTVGYARLSKPASRKDAQLKSKLVQE